MYIVYIVLKWLEHLTGSAGILYKYLYILYIYIYIVSLKCLWLQLRVSRLKYF